MKTLCNRIGFKTLSVVTLLVGFQSALFAQDTKVEVNGNDVGTWFGNNWLWITGVIVLLLLIILFSGGSSRRKVTTVERNGHHKRVTTTTTEEED